jgi:hypothetical protein
MPFSRLREDHAQNKALARRVGALPLRYLKVVGYRAARMSLCDMNFRKFLLGEALRKNRTLAGPVVVCRPKPATPSRGEQLAANLVTTWEERRQGCLQRNWNMRCIAPANNAERRMSAMLARDAELICVNRETSRKISVVRDEKAATR